MKWLRRILRTLAVLLVVGLVVLYFIAPGMILYPRRVNWDRHPADFQLPAENISVRTADSIEIKGIWVHPAQDSAHRRTIILLHGVGNCKERWLPTAQWLWQAGYATVLIDLRAHGQSGGQYCTYGYFEKHDVQAVVDYLLSRDSTLQLGVWGHSLGGAVALQTLAIEPRLQFGVVESTFANFRDIVYDYQWRMFKVSSRTFADDAIRRAAEKSHFQPDSVRPVEAARFIRQPILMNHGDQDERISINYGRAIFNNLSSRDKQFRPVAGAHHSDLSHYGGSAYQQEILRFLACQ